MFVGTDDSALPYYYYLSFPIMYWYRDSVWGVVGVELVRKVSLLKVDEYRNHILR